MTYQQTIDYLFRSLPMYQRVGSVAYKKDLSNTLKLCELLGNPHQKIKTVHIAGTNGKGSSAHMLAAILQSAGYKTGLYTSPHLKNFTERIKINGEEINEEAVVGFVDENKIHFEAIKPSFFETTVAMAFDYFATNKVDIAVIEVGLGGRLDSTNIITPLVSLITNIGYDHQQMLGESLGEIAKEKAGIIKQNVPVIIGERHVETQEVFLQMAKEKSAPIKFASDNVAFYRNDFELDLKGEYQIKNLQGVIEVTKVLNDIEYYINKEHIKVGIENTSKLTGIKGRWQILDAFPLTICDTAHNSEGISAVFEQLLSLNYEKLHIVWGMVNDKEINKILKLLPKEANYYFCQPNVPRGMDVVELNDNATKIGLRGLCVKKVNEAIKIAKEKASPEDLIYIGGSTFVVAEIDGL
ncbi:MAG: bifunctional folylpolyglutamate synthase/dihydrofolate synthase [Cyclobacteriaceae bacterium]|nr:bifunctional folylpolyglutamate synthase/dihydrofolate synthase [Cyclobacteriaceae bacterium]